ncbi:MAG: hypothetical protein GF331_14030 [Chitinivibrionales bacterium]|nr:hypothetical protein [Chitinivibrionales bacterium]
MLSTKFVSLAAGILALCLGFASSSAQELNLWFDSVGVERDTLIPGEQVRCDIYLNTDYADTVDLVDVGIYVSADTLVDSADFAFPSNAWRAWRVYASDESAQRKAAFGTLSTTAAPGDWWLLFVLDPADSHAETDEDDNLAMLTVRIVEPDIDVSYKIARFAQDTVNLGDTLEFDYSFRNDGSTAAYPLTTIIYLSADPAVDDADRVLYSYDKRYLGPFHNTGSSQSHYPDKVLLETFPVCDTTVYGIFTIEAPEYLGEMNLTNNITIVPVYLRGDGTPAVRRANAAAHAVTTTAVQPSFNLLGQPLPAQTRSRGASGLLVRKDGARVRIVKDCR